MFDFHRFVPPGTGTGIVALLATVFSGAALAASLGPVADTNTIEVPVKPGDNFYRFANGGWLGNTPLPQGKTRYDSAAAMKAETARRVQDLIQGAARAASAQRSQIDQSARQKVGEYYSSWMDVARIEGMGLGPMASELASIAAITDRRSLSAYLGSTLRSDDGTNSQTAGLFGAWIHQGFHEPDRYLPHLVQGGLGLPDRDDYLNGGVQKAERRNIYRAHVAAVLKLASFIQPSERAQRILTLETAIANTHSSQADTDDVFKTDNRWRRADFDARAAGMDWRAYFDAAGLGRQADFYVWQPSAMTGAGALVASQPIEIWKDYLAFHLIEASTAVLPKLFGDEHTAFIRHLSGTPISSDRQQEAISAVNLALGDAVGKIYVERYFPPEAKAVAARMASNLLSAYRARIPTLTWMSVDTRKRSLAKLAAMKIGVGYPDTWIDYSGLEIVRGDAYGNLHRAEAFAWRRDRAKIGQPIDPSDWPLLSQTVSANINLSPNALQFSAGLLQPPFFDPTGDVAANYGSAGAAMGHEISHSFDELGNAYDAKGSLGVWWTAEDLAKYRATAASLVAQFNAYCPESGFCVNGKLVLSENIADLTGLVVAHDAYLLALNGKPDAIKEGLSGEQRFYLAYGQRWRRVQTDAALKQQLATDTHAPGEYRSSTVRNEDAWYQAYDIQPGDKLYLQPADRIHIW